jgi:hypothetical protein
MAGTDRSYGAPFEPGPGRSASQVELDDRGREQSRKLFEEVRRACAVDMSWAQTSQLPITGAFAQQALFADLLVLGQGEWILGGASRTILQSMTLPVLTMH